MHDPSVGLGQAYQEYYGRKLTQLKHRCGFSKRDANVKSLILSLCYSTADMEENTSDLGKLILKY